MDFQEVLRRRCSVRSYTGEKVTEEELAALLQAAQAAPVGCAEYTNYRLTVTEDPELIAELENTFAAVNGKPGAHPVYGAPLLIIVSARVGEGDIANRYYSTAACIAENMTLQATEMGIGSCLLWGIIRSMNKVPEMVNRLGLPEGFTPVCSVCFGRTEKNMPVREIGEGRIPVTRL